MNMLYDIEIKYIFAESGPKAVWEHGFWFSMLSLIWLVIAIMIHFILCNRLLHTKWQLNHVLSNNQKKSITVTFRGLRIMLLSITCFLLKLKCFRKILFFFQTTCNVAVTKWRNITVNTMNYLNKKLNFILWIEWSSLFWF